ncbi:low-density lipoprotein receptor-related protein 4 [Trichonephila clavipes]|nr:low-density lipoprotein receptor-related protein 4 [Trichonephila clavipes]
MEVRRIGYQLRCALWNGSDPRTIISTDLVTADGLAVDWVAKNLYWTDSGRKIIEVSRVDGSSRKVLVDLDLDEPRAIVVFPRKGYLFWSDWGKPPKIERAYLDGTGRRVIVATDLGWPNGLTIDYDARRLYWVDAQLDRIETSDLSGKHRLQLVDDVAHPFGLTLFGPHLFWTDWHTKSIERVDKDTGRNRIVIRDNIEYLMEIKMVAASRQTGSNPCGERNGGCSHLCLFKPEGRVCACPSYNDSRRCSTVPGDILLEPTKKSEIDEKVTVKDTSVPTTLPADSSTRCSEIDIQKGRCDIIGYPPPDPILQTAYIALSVILLIVVIVLTMALVFWKRNNKRRNEDLEDTLTFSNPTYSTSSGDTLPSDRKVWPWKNQHRSKKQVFWREESDNSLEAGSCSPRGVITPHSLRNAEIRSVKWWHRIFYFLIYLAIISSFIVASEEKKQKFRPDNIPYSSNSSANRRIFLKQARLMGVCPKESQLNNLEVSALVSRNKMSSLNVLHPPAPPQRIDSRQSFAGMGASPCKMSHSPLPYRTVETDI